MLRKRKLQRLSKFNYYIFIEYHYIQNSLLFIYLHTDRAERKAQRLASEQEQKEKDAQKRAEIDAQIKANREAKIAAREAAKAEQEAAAAEKQQEADLKGVKFVDTSMPSY